MSDAVAQLWPKLAVPGRGVAYFARGGRGVTGGVARDEVHFRRIISNLNGAGFNTYVHLNPTDHPRGYKASLDRVTGWRHCFIDVDPIEKSADPAAVAREALELLPVGSTTWIFSGRGHQLWLEVRPMDLVGGADGCAAARRVVASTRVFLERLAAQLTLRGCVLDITSANLAQVARMPGTVNRASGRTAKLLRLATTPADPQLILAHEPPPERSEPPVRMTGPLTFRQVWPKLTETADRFILCGIGRGRRHNDAFAAARCLEELGVSREQAQGWLWVGAQKCRPRMSLSDLEYIVRSAYKEG